MKTKSNSKNGIWCKALIVLHLVSCFAITAVAGNNENTLESNDVMSVQQNKKTRPSWISTTGKVLEVVKKDDTKVIRYRVTYKNNNKEGRIVTAIFDKSLKLRGTLSRTNSIPIDIPFEHTLRSSNVSKMKLYPGQTHTITYSFNIKKGASYSAWQWEKMNAAEAKLTFKTAGWSHDFQVQTTK